jgi:hypothetical protein
MPKDLCVRETYKKDNEEKTSWNKIGILFEKNDKQYIKLFHMPGVLVSVFEKRAKEESKETTWLPGEEENA